MDKDRNKQVLFELIQVALGNRAQLSIIPMAEEWYAVYEESMKQSVAGICLSGVEHLSIANEGQIVNMPRMLKLEWIGSVEQIKHQNHILNKKVETLATLLDKHHIRYAVVKGQVVASYYERPEYIQSGDIDFYVPQE